MGVDEARELIGFCFVDFADRVGTIGTEVLQSLRARLVAEGDNGLTRFGIEAIDRVLSQRA